MGRDFRKMDIWQLAYKILLDVYPLLEAFPIEETRNVVDQLRRAATSIPLNIAEGAGSHSNKVFLNHLSYAYTSAKEMDVLLMLSRDLGYIDIPVYDFLYGKMEELRAKMFKFMVSVEREIKQKRPNFNYCREKYKN